MSMGRATCPLLWAAALGGCPAVWSISHHKGYCSRLSTVRPPHPCDPLLDCVPARLSPVASMAPGDVCHGPRCSLAGLGPVALEYRSCHWPGGSAGSPQCVRPMGYWFFPVPRPPYVCAVSWAAGLLFTGVPARFAVVRLRCPGPAGSCSPVCSLGVLCCMCGVLGHWAPVHRCACCVRCSCAMGGCVPLPPPLIFVFFSCFFFSTCFFFFWKKREKQKRVKQGRAYTAGTGTGSWCGGAIALCPLACVVGAVAALAPQGCGSRVLMYTGLGQGGFGEVSLCFWSWLVRWLCGLWVWAVVTLFPRQAWLGVKG